MSETLTAEELPALKEMPCNLEMGELRKITTLQDIPLAVGDSLPQTKITQEESNEESERKLKTNSLKRFFRLSPKKKFGEGSLDAGTSVIEFEEGKIPDAASSQKELAGSFSKSSLKASLNTYWNSVFKQRKSRKSSKSQMDLEPNVNEASSSNVNLENLLPNDAVVTDLQDNVCNIEDKSVLEEIQSLKISEECPQN